MTNPLRKNHVLIMMEGDDLQEQFDINRIEANLTENSPLEGPVTGFNRHMKLMSPATRELVLQSRATEIEAFAMDRGYNPALVTAVAEVAMRMGRVPDLHQYGFSGGDALAVKHFISGDILNNYTEDAEAEAHAALLATENSKRVAAEAAETAEGWEDLDDLTEKVSYDEYAPAKGKKGKKGFSYADKVAPHMGKGKKLGAEFVYKAKHKNKPGWKDFYKEFSRLSPAADAKSALGAAYALTHEPDAPQVKTHKGDKFRMAALRALAGGTKSWYDFQADLAVDPKMNPIPGGAYGSKALGRNAPYVADKVWGGQWNTFAKKAKAEGMKLAEDTDVAQSYGEFLGEMKMGSGVKKEFVFSTKEKAQAFIDKLKSDGRRFKGKPKVKKTKGWKTFSAIVHFFALGDTVGLKYTPEKPSYRDIMRDLKESETFNEAAARSLKVPEGVEDGSLVVHWDGNTGKHIYVYSVRGSSLTKVAESSVLRRKRVIHNTNGEGAVPAKNFTWKKLAQSSGLLSNFVHGYLAQIGLGALRGKPVYVVGPRKQVIRKLGESVSADETLAEGAAQTTWKQLHKMKINGFPLTAYLGAKNPVADKDQLTVTLRGKWKGRVVIKLNRGTDLYDLTFGRVRKYEWKVDCKVLGVEVGNLAHVLQRYVEYGEARGKKGKVITADVMREAQGETDPALYKLANRILPKHGMDVSPGSSGEIVVTPKGKHFPRMIVNGTHGGKIQMSWEVMGRSPQKWKLPAGGYLRIVKEIRSFMEPAMKTEHAPQSYGEFLAEADAGELSAAEKLVLGATFEFKSKHMGRDRRQNLNLEYLTGDKLSGISLADWHKAASSLVSKKLLRMNGSITRDGKAARQANGGHVMLVRAAKDYKKHEDCSVEALIEAVNFKRAAKVLLKKATDAKKPIGYTGYLRAVIQGNSDQATHMRSSKSYMVDAGQAMQDLIDMAGKAKYESVPTYGEFLREGSAGKKRLRRVVKAKVKKANAGKMSTGDFEKFAGEFNPKVKSKNKQRAARLSADVADRYGEFLSEATNAKALLKKYLSNEDDNRHAENYLLLAKAYGTPAQVKKVQAILKRNKAQGHTSKSDNDWMYKNINPHYRTLVRDAKSKTEDEDLSEDKTWMIAPMKGKDFNVKGIDGVLSGVWRVSMPSVSPKTNIVMHRVKKNGKLYSIHVRENMFGISTKQWGDFAKRGYLKPHGEVNEGQSFDAALLEAVGDGYTTRQLLIMPGSGTSLVEEADVDASLKHASGKYTWTGPNRVVTVKTNRESAAPNEVRVKQLTGNKVVYASDGAEDANFFAYVLASKSDEEAQKLVKLVKQGKDWVKAAGLSRTSFQSGPVFKAFKRTFYKKAKHEDKNIAEVSPPGFSGTVKAMKKSGDEIDNPYSLAWSMFNKGDKPHKKPEADAKGVKQYISPEKYAKYTKKKA